MGYIPNVQFAPYYVADQRGYYRQAGLTVTFNYAFSPNLMELTGAGKIDFANADGTDAIAAEAQGVPLMYVAAEYQRLPSAIFALAKTHLRKMADLKRKTVGVPGRFGSSWVALLAALHAAHMGLGDIKVDSIGYTQATSVAAGKVDAAVGFSTNEPVLLARHGYKVSTIEVSSVADLVGPGLVTSRNLVARNPVLVRAFVQATLHGLADTIADPRAAFALCRREPGLTALHGADVDDQFAVLLRTIDFWHDAGTRTHGLGYADPRQWRDSARILQEIGQVPHPPRPATLYSNAFAQGAPAL
jgi:NitT/TauT family transport system substrate-binding protein